MKKILLAAVILFAAESFAAQTNFPQPMRLFNLLDARFEPEAQAPRATGGQLMLTPKEAALNIQFAFHCPAGRICPEVMPQPLVTRLPIVGVKPSNCGDRYMAVRDGRKTDGLYEQIELVDYSRANCEMVMHSMIQAVYSVSYFDRAQNRVVTKRSMLSFNPQNPFATR